MAYVFIAKQWGVEIPDQIMDKLKKASELVNLAILDRESFLNREFEGIVHGDEIRVLDEAMTNKRDPGQRELVRLAFPFGKHNFGDLHRLIAEVNRF